MPDPVSRLLVSSLPEENLLVNLPAEDRASVVKALVQNLVATGKIQKGQAAAVTRLVNEREEKGSTAIGGGVAMPHARVSFSDAVIAAFALLAGGDGFNALDGAPVRYVFLVLTPKDNEDLHREMLRAVTGFVRKPIHLKALSGCHTPAEIKSVFQDYA